MGKLHGKVAIVIGGSTGIGLSTAEKFASEGAYVFITGRRQSELDKAVAAIGHNVTAIQGDMTNLADLDRIYATVRQAKGVLHAVVASAGVVKHASLEQATPEHYDEIFNTNARGVFFSVQKALPLMTQGGSIVLVSSGLHLKGFPGHGAYSATKAALRSFSRTWAVELKERGIRVNTLSPGAIETPLFKGQFASPEHEAGARATFNAMTPLGRIGRPEEMAAAALFLASDDSSYCTASDLVADGGATGV